VYSKPVMENGVPLGWRARGGSDVGAAHVFTVEFSAPKRGPNTIGGGTWELAALRRFGVHPRLLRGTADATTNEPLR
jgi:hypothetical protein